MKITKEDGTILTLDINVLEGAGLKIFNDLEITYEYNKDTKIL